MKRHAERLQTGVFPQRAHCLNYRACARCIAVAMPCRPTADVRALRGARTRSPFGSLSLRTPFDASHRSASLRAALTPPPTGATAPHGSPSAGWSALAPGRRVPRLLLGVAIGGPRLRRRSRINPGSSTSRVASGVDARCAFVLTNAPSARSLRQMILPCGASRQCAVACLAKEKQPGPCTRLLFRNPYSMPRLV